LNLSTRRESETSDYRFHLSPGCGQIGAGIDDEIGAAPFLTVPDANAAERQIAAFEEGSTLAQIYAEQVRAGTV